ncbi:hypothetical protein [Nocardioides cynanchi]|uniref:hypothetical protein n=1 Tax=Nocardioides cynanchi TaxID=2558918 RepID=UPI00124892A0|nr:hypothetical protein [Nocardioides cynanchi]
MSSREPDPSSYDEVDAFDLPDWLGVETVTWGALAGLGSGHRVEGELTAQSREPLGCDLLAVDDAYPAPVAPDSLRVRVHQLWRHGEVLVLGDADRLVLALPGSRLDPETVLEAVGRLAHAVGSTGGFGVRLRAGGDHRR